MSNDFPLRSDAFSGGARLTTPVRDQGLASHLAPLWELLNEAASAVEGDIGPLTALPLTLLGLPEADLATLNRGLTRETGGGDVFLPTIADTPDGWSHVFNATDGAANAVNLTPDTANGDTINAAAVFAMSRDGQSVRVVKPTAGQDWVVLGG